MLYNALYNTQSMVILPAIESLSDLAFQKGWRIMHSNLDSWEIKRYTERFNCEVMDGSRFYTDYLADDELDEQDAEYLGSLIDPLWENTAVLPDADEEEFDESFSSFEETDEETEEE